MDKRQRVDLLARSFAFVANGWLYSRKLTLRQVRAQLPLSDRQLACLAAVIRCWEDGRPMRPHPVFAPEESFTMQEIEDMLAVYLTHAARREGRPEPQCPACGWPWARLPWWKRLRGWLRGPFADVRIKQLRPIDAEVRWLRCCDRACETAYGEAKLAMDALERAAGEPPSPVC